MCVQIGRRRDGECGHLLRDRCRLPIHTEVGAADDGVPDGGWQGQRAKPCFGSGAAREAGFPVIVEHARALVGEPGRDETRKRHFARSTNGRPSGKVGQMTEAKAWRAERIGQ